MSPDVAPNSQSSRQPRARPEIKRMRQLSRRKVNRTYGAAASVETFALVARQYRAAGSPIQPALVEAMYTKFIAARDVPAYCASVARAVLEQADGDARHALALLVDRLREPSGGRLKRDAEARERGYPHHEAWTAARRHL